MSPAVPPLQSPPTPWPSPPPSPLPPPPRHWAAADVATLGAVRGVLTDIDDTLTRHGRIEPAALDALGRLARAGLPVIAVTGRPAGWCEALALDWPLRAVVAENGGVLLFRAGRRRIRCFAQDAGTRRHQMRRLRHCAAQVLAQVPGARLARDSPGRLTDIAIDHGEQARLGPAAIAAVVALMRAQGLCVSVSSIHINGWLGAHDKWSGARWAARLRLGRPLVPAEWLAVGDSANDQALFAQVSLSAGVANIAACLPTLTHPPAYITVADRGLGFAEVADRLLALVAANAGAGDR